MTTWHDDDAVDLTHLKLEPELLTWREGALGRLHLNRPRAINALTLPVILALRAALEEWRSDPQVSTVALTGEGERGFCAGGDIRFVWENAVAAPERVLELWREEYALDLTIATYPKPVVVLADGITMGGGIGLAGHASHRIVTPRSRLAMPEVRIGLAPDVAGLWLLARAPHELGTHLALTGASADAKCSLLIGWADAIVPVERLGQLLADLRDAHADDAVARHQTVVEPTVVPEWVPRCYSHDDARDVLAALRAEPNPAAGQASDELLAASPTAVAVTLAGLRAAAELTVAQCLLQDYRLSSRFLATSDLPEGIRARIVDKNSVPRWSPADIAEVEPELVASFFEPAADESQLADTLTNIWTDHKVPLM
jgi:enoyl-CoA hydratase